MECGSREEFNYKASYVSKDIMLVPAFYYDVKVDCEGARQSYQKLIGARGRLIRISR